MNVALPALIAFFILLPGFIFRTKLKRAERTTLDFSPFGQVVAEAILWALVLHLAWLWVSFAVFRHAFEPTILMKLLSSAPQAQSDATEAVGAQFNWIGAYFATQICVSYLLPAIVRIAITHFRLDRADARFSAVFRYHQAPWYYLLTGADFEAKDAPDIIIVSAIVEVGKEAVLYVGILDDFYFNADGELDRLILQSVARRPISADKSAGPPALNPESRFYNVDGDSFVLRYKEAITLNIQYVRLTPDDSGADSAS